MTSSQRWTMLAAILGSSMVFLDGTVVNLALPKIGATLPSSLVSTLEGQTYVVSGYLATLAALLVLAGALADYHGRRRLFAIGLAGFGLASILCGIAPSLELLVVFRILQGAAGALLVPAPLAILTALFDGPARARAIGIWAAATSAAILVGPVVGGLLVDVIDWRAAFLVNVPLVVVALYATLRYIAETRAEDAAGQFDWAGAGVAVVAIGGLAFGAIRGQDRQWTDPIGWIALGIGAVALVAFPVLMARRSNPLVPLDLFRRRRFATVNLSTLLIYGALYVTLTVQALFVQGVLGYSATAAGMVTLPQGVFLTLLSTRIGSLAGRYGPRRFLVAGPLLMAAAVAWLIRIPASSGAWRLTWSDPATFAPPVSAIVDLGPYVLLFSVGLSLLVAPLTTALMASVPVAKAGLASALNNAISRVGQPLILALIFVVVSDSFYAALAGAVAGVDPASAALRDLVQPLNPPRPGAPAAIVDAARLASTSALHVAALVCAGLLAAGAVANWIGLREPATVEEPATADADAV